MDEGTRARRSRSFGGAADIYERARPTYPGDAVDWLIPEGAGSVADLGAGTGKFTRSLLGRGLTVFAVEPDIGMLGTLARALPEVTALEGTAEQIPLDDASVDAVTVAQAWHWVDESLALPEVARVLRPGGRLGLIWNLRDDRPDWVRRFDEIIGSSDAEDHLKQRIVIGAPFGETERFVTEWSMEVDTDALVELAASRSYIITATEERRAQVFAEVRELVATHPDLAGRDRFELPYRTFAFRAHTPVE